MAFTAVANMVVHDAFSKYFQRALLERSVFFKSGILATDPQIAEKCNEAGFGGNFVSLPFFNALSTSDKEERLDEHDLVPSNVTTGEDVAVIVRRGKAFGANDLATDVAGADPMITVANQLADYWNARNERRLFSVLKGVFAKNVAADDSLRKPLRDCGFADARFTDEYGVVFGTAGENLQDAPNLAIAPDDGVNLPLPCTGCEVCAVFFQGLEFFLGVAVAYALVTAHLLQGGQVAAFREPALLQQTAQPAIRLHDAQHNVLHAQVVIFHACALCLGFRQAGIQLRPYPGTLGHGSCLSRFAVQLLAQLFCQSGRGYSRFLQY